MRGFRFFFWLRFAFLAIVAVLFGLVALVLNPLAGLSAVLGWFAGAICPVRATSEQRYQAGIGPGSARKH